MSRAFLRGVAFMYVGLGPIRGLATPFVPELPFFRNLDTPQLAVGRVELVVTTQNCVVATQNCVVWPHNTVLWPGLCPGPKGPPGAQAPPGPPGP